MSLNFVLPFLVTLEYCENRYPMLLITLLLLWMKVYTSIPWISLEADLSSNVQMTLSPNSRKPDPYNP